MKLQWPEKIIQCHLGSTGKYRESTASFTLPAGVNGGNISTASSATSALSAICTLIQLKMVMTMFNLKYVFVTSSMSLLSAGMVHSAFAADPVAINVTGTVVASPCTIDDSAASSLTILGTLQSADLNAAGSGSAWVPINVKFKSCPAGTSTITATFHGTADAGDPNNTLQQHGGR
jgi:hypothetical protein